MRQHARLLERPEAVILGSTLTRDAASGAMVLFVDNAGDFDDTEGGTLRVRLSEEDPAGADLLLAYNSWDEDDNTGEEYVELSAALSQSLPAGVRVDVWDVESASPDVTYEGRVVMDDAPADSDPREVTVSQALIDQLTPNGLPGRDASVTVERYGGDDEWFLVEVHGLRPVVDGDYLDPDTLPPVEVIPTTPPAAPTNLTAVPKAYLAGRVPSSRFNLSWSGVSTDETGASISDVRGYDVDEQPSGAPWRFRTHTTDLGVAVSPYVPDSVWSFRVRAVRQDGTVGAWSSSVTVTAPRDTEAPPVPSKPTASARLGVARFGWGGFSSTGAAMPADFDRVEVHVSTTDGFTPTAGATATLLGSITGAGELVKSDGTYNSTYYVRLIAIDLWGNASAPSAQEFVIVKPLVDTDVIGQAISGANIKDGTITASDKVVANTVTSALIKALAIQAGHISANAVTADKVEAGAIVADKIAANAVTAAKIMAEAVTAEKIKAAAITADKIDAGAITATKIAANAVTATSLASDAIDGKTITGALIRTAASGQRWQMGSNETRQQILGYSGDADELQPSLMQIFKDAAGYLTYLLASPRVSRPTGLGLATIQLRASPTLGTNVGLTAETIRLTADSLEVSTGVQTSIRAALGIQSAQVTTPSLAAGTPQTVTVTFPTAYPVGTTPVVSAWFETVSAVNVLYPLAINNVTRTGFEIRVARSSGTGALIVRWRAEPNT